MAKKPNFEVALTFEVGKLPIKASFQKQSDGRQFLTGIVDLDGKGKLRDLVTDDLKAYTPDIEVEEVFCIIPNNFKGGTVFGAKLGMDFDLTDLPLVGEKIPESYTIGINDLSVVFSTDKLEISKNKVFAKGVNISTNLKLGNYDLPLAVSQGIADAPSSGAVSPSKKKPTKKSGNGVYWVDLNKSAGPITFQRLGFQYANESLWLLLDGSMSVAGFSLALDGLGVGSSLKEFSPKFTLRGLSIAYQKGAFAIMGGLLRTKRTAEDGTPVTTYDGIVLIKTAAFSLTALGSYAEFKGKASLFIYGLFLRPIGGPPFLFVTGISAGFGLNRGLNLPNVENTLDFPLVGVVMGTQDLTKDPFQLLQSLSKDIPPVSKQYFLCFGIKFTTFKLIDSFALLTVGFGKSYSLDILGISRLVVPPKVGNSSVLAQVEMAIRVSYDFEEQALKVKAVLTDNSYVLSRNCRLTGGFAFYSWFAGQHAGDFVYTLGGYHPSFKVPAHYPKVPRAGLSWQINGNLSVKGTMYYALCSSACMAGGSLEATWRSGNLSAWFILKADFIISWKPYFYEASFSVSIGVRYTLKVKLGFLGTIRKTFKFNLGVGVKVWGPEFAGYAKISLSIISFTIRFGNQQKPRLSALAWDDFKQSFLPPAEQMLTLNVKDGLLKTIPKEKSNDQQEHKVVNPKELSVALDTAIPVSKLALTNFPEPKSFGIGTMGKTNVDSELKIVITNDGVDVTSRFTIEGIEKNMPKALWQKADREGVYRKPTLDSDLITGLLGGISITPAPREKPEITQERDLTDFSYDVEAKAKAFDWTQELATKTSEQSIAASIASEDVAKQRIELLQVLGIDQEVKVTNLASGNDFSDAFLMNPTIVETSE